MQRLVFRLSIAILTFFVGIAASQFSFRSRPLSAVTIATPVDVPALPIPKAARTYQLRVAGHGVTEDNFSFAVSSVQSSDGAGFARRSIYYDSDQCAHRELQRALRRAKAIISREAFKVEDSSRPGGEKVLATFAKGSPYGAAALLWTDGPTFISISSSSLQDLLRYEQDLRQSGQYGP